MDIALLSGRPNGDIQSKGFIVTRVRGTRPHEVFWVVRHKLGQSSVAYAFEENLTQHFKVQENRASISTQQQNVSDGTSDFR